MRLALVTSQAFSLSNFRGPLIVAMVARGVEVFAIAPDHDDQTRKSMLTLGATPMDIAFDRAGMNPLSDVMGAVRLAILLRRLKVDVALTYFIKPVIFGTFAAVMAGVPKRFCMIEGLGYVFTPSERREPTGRKMLRAVVSLLYRFALRFADKVFLLNDDDIADLVNRGLLQSRQVVKIGGIGVDLDKWLPVPPVVSPITFLLAARLLREKGVVEFSQAARIVKAAHPGVRFVLLGGVDSNPGSLSIHQVTDWVSEGVMEWPGNVPVKSWFAQASVYVLPSYREGVPRSTQEAMAMGRAVITTNVPGCRETVIDGHNGFLVPVRSAEALAQAMIRFIEQPDLIESMGRASRAMAVQRFDVHKVNEIIMRAMGFGK